MPSLVPPPRFVPAIVRPDAMEAGKNQHRFTGPRLSSRSFGARLGGTSGKLLILATGPDPWKAITAPTLQAVADRAVILIGGFAKSSSAPKIEAAAPQKPKALPKSEALGAAALPKAGFTSQESAPAPLKPSAQQAAVEEVAIEQEVPLGSPAKAASEALRLVNEYRRSHRLPPLTLDRNLSSAALAQAADMARHNRFSHLGPNGADLDKRLTAAGYNYAVAAENVAVGKNSAAGLIADWKTKPLESQNLLLPDAKQMGIAFKYRSDATLKTFWTLVIASRS
ncbi:MAG: CAP domain-containing protein [Rhodomicrobium sp.]